MNLYNVTFFTLCGRMIPITIKAYNSEAATYKAHEMMPEIYEVYKIDVQLIKEGQKNVY